MNNKTEPKPATFFVAYQQVLGREKIKGLVHLLLFFGLLTIATALVSADDQKPVSQPEEIIMKQAPQQPVANAASPDSFQLDRFSINAAGAIDDSSASYKLGLSVGQPVVGTASSASYQTGTGFWYGPYLFKPGDANEDGVINAADVVYLINYLFIHGPAPVPLQAGDVNCDGTTNAADVVYLINYLFIKGPPPGC
jgi:hypothetical protein